MSADVGSMLQAWLTTEFALQPVIQLVPEQPLHSVAVAAPQHCSTLVTLRRPPPPLTPMTKTVVPADTAELLPMRLLENLLPFMSRFHTGVKLVLGAAPCVAR